MAARKTSQLGYGLIGSLVLGEGPGGTSAGVTASTAVQNILVTPLSAFVIPGSGTITAAGTPQYLVTPLPVTVSTLSVPIAGTGRLTFTPLPVGLTTGATVAVAPLAILWQPQQVHMPPAREPWITVPREDRAFSVPAENRVFVVRKSL